MAERPIAEVVEQRKLVLLEGRGTWPLLLVVLLITCILALLAGKFPLTGGDLSRSILAQLGLGAAESSSTVDTVLWQLRLPRILAALLVGASLAAAGAAYQNMFRNPLVSPDILGVSAGAGLGAVLGIFLSLPMMLVQGLAFIGGLAAVGVVYAVAGMVRRHDPVLVLVLAGVA